MTTLVSLSEYANAFEKLDTTGRNWLMFQHRLEIAVRQKGVWPHFDGSSKKPVAADPNKPTTDETDLIQEWQKKENLALYLLTQKLSDTTVTKYRRRSSVTEIWSAIVSEFTQKSILIRSNLRTQFSNLCYTPGADLHAEFDRIRVKHEELLNLEINISEAEYASLIIAFLPPDLSAFVLQISATAKATMLMQQRAAAMSSTTPSTTAVLSQIDLDKEKPLLDAETLMALVLEEWDRRKMLKGAMPKVKDPGVAASAVSTEKPKGGKGKGPRKPVGVCWNCGGKGHKEADCPTPKQGSRDKDKGSKSAEPSKSTSKPTAASAVTLDDIAGAWSAFIPADFSDDSVSSVLDLWSVSDDDSDYSALTEASTDNDEMPDLVSMSNLSASEFDDESASDAQSCDAGDAISHEDGLEVARAHEAARHPVDVLLKMLWVDDWVIEVAVAKDESNEEDAPRVPDIVLALAATKPKSSYPTDLYDSGASHHMSPFREDFLTFHETMPQPLNAANQQDFVATGVGDMIIAVPNSPGPTKMKLTRVLYTPAIAFNLISIGRIDDAGCTVTFGGQHCEIRDRDGHLLGMIPKMKGLYTVVRQHEKPSAYAARHVKKLTVMQLHRLMGHIAPRVARELVTKGLVRGVKLVESDEPKLCKVCIRAKSMRRPVLKEREGKRATEFGGEVHSDLWGPSRIQTLGGRKYYISFMDDCTRFSTAYLLRQKSEAFMSYKAFEAWVKTHMGVDITVLNTDRGGEYLSDAFVRHLEEQGTEQKLSVHDTHGESGISEHLNRTVAEKGHAMLIAAGLPRFLWGEAVLHAIYLKNRTSTKALNGRTPYEAVTGDLPDLSGIPEWGARIWVHDTATGKMGERAKPGHWVGFDTQSKGHRVYWPDKRSVTVECNVRFGEPHAVLPNSDDGLELEGEEPAGDKPEAELSVSAPDLPISAPEPASNVLVPSNVPAKPASHQTPAELPHIPQRPVRNRQPTRYVRDICTGKAESKKLPTGMQVPDEAEKSRSAEASLQGELEEPIGGVAMAAKMADVEGLEPRTIGEAKKRPEWPRWEEAIVEELRALEAHGTWRLEKAPTGANVVSCRWVFAAKKDAAGNVYRYRARLVARGFSQIPGVDFFDTDAPVAKTASIRVALAFAARHDFEVHQIDVKSAYLHGEFEENEVIYMSLPPGTNLTKEPGMVLRLLRPLYGLRQSARHWHKKLLRALQEFLRMVQCDVDQAVFFRIEGTDLIVIVVHVDDLTIVTSSRALIDERFGFEDLKPLTTPMDPNTTLSSAQSPQTTTEAAAMRDIPYREAVGSLMYASLDNPGRAHWEAVKRVFRYLSGTKDLKLTYGAQGLDLVGYTDADGSMHEDRKAISGYAFLIDSGAVSWSSKRQEIIALSTTEAEYVAATHAAKEALWLCSLIGQVFQPFSEAVTLYSDNQSAIALSRDNQYHARTKHIDIRFHFIRWIVEEEKLKLIYCPTEDMVADCLTKALPSPKVKHFAAALGLC
ncbi:hypothetical protein SCP_0601800 [Sparassis crispa]|uniref:Retrovirus-related Pol polyprotein from transposon TNT 1-94 n=1 Tax=Sparassis crispa TaxID=139825 RepID=A0A401GPS6_9APHY|nr:hypothetical protein SCP_0601800 [Sparassis crispa]GBE84202.1 hypothetical protein SCP_0601800 [Sparassis crispa]